MINWNVNLMNIIDLFDRMSESVNDGDELLTDITLSELVTR